MGAPLPMRQDPQRRKAGRSSCRAANQIRAGDQFEDNEATWFNNSAECVGESGSGDPMTVSREQSAVGSKNKEIA
jgi:hypothetical protein